MVTPQHHRQATTWINDDTLASGIRGMFFKWNSDYDATLFSQVLFSPQCVKRIMELFLCLILLHNKIVIYFNLQICAVAISVNISLLWRHNERDGVSNHRRLVVYSTVCSDADQRKHQSSASLAFVRGIHRWPVNSPHKGPVTRKMFLFDDVIMYLHKDWLERFTK